MCWGGTTRGGTTQNLGRIVPQLGAERPRLGLTWGGSTRGGSTEGRIDRKPLSLWSSFPNFISWNSPITIFQLILCILCCWCFRNVYMKSLKVTILVVVYGSKWIFWDCTLGKWIRHFHIAPATVLTFPNLLFVDFQFWSHGFRCRCVAASHSCDQSLTSLFCSSSTSCTIYIQHACFCITLILCIALAASCCLNITLNMFFLSNNSNTGPVPNRRSRVRVIMLKTAKDN